MKRISTIVLFLSLTSLMSYSQCRFKFGVSAGSYQDIRPTEFYSYYGNYITINQYYGYYSGLNLKYKLSEKMNIETGINYYYKYLQINLFGGSAGSYFGGSKINSLSVPVNLSFHKEFPKLENLSFEIFGGISESLYFQDKYQYGGQRDTTIMIKETNGFYYELKYPNYPVMSAQTGVNIIYKTPNSGAFAIGFEYYLMTGNYLNGWAYDFVSSDVSARKEHEVTYQARDSRLVFKLSYIFKERNK